MNWLLRRFSRVRELEALLDSAISQRDAKDHAIKDLAECNSDLSAKYVVVTKALQDSTAQSAMLEDRLSAAYEDRQRLWDLVKTSIEGERTAYQMHINVVWGKEGRGAPYPEAPQLPQHQVQQPITNSIVSRPLTGSERVAAGTRDFIQQYTTQLQGQLR